MSALRKTDGRTGIFAHNDMEALIIMNGLMRAGIAIPEQVALAGFDDTFFGQRILPGLTSVRQPIREMAAYAVSQVMGQIGKEAPAQLLRREFQPELIIRGSSQRG